MKMPQSGPRVYRAGQSFQFETRYRKSEITATRRICKIQGQRQRLWKVYGNTESITSRFPRHRLYRAGPLEIFMTCLLSLLDTYILVQQNRGFIFLSIRQKNSIYSIFPVQPNIAVIFITRSAKNKKFQVMQLWGELWWKILQYSEDLWPGNAGRKKFCHWIWLRIKENQPFLPR